MQPISIRLPTSLMETFKLLGQEHGLGYQPLMRRVLARFAEAESGKDSRASWVAACFRWLRYRCANDQFDFDATNVSSRQCLS